MKILMVAAEMAPFAKVGGLADVVQGLSSALRTAGHDARVLLPLHPGAEGLVPAEPFRTVTIEDPLGAGEVHLFAATAPGGIPVVLARDDRYFGSRDVYGEPDDRLRYEFLCRTAIHIVEHSGWVPDIVHLHDWHTAPLAFGLRNRAWHNPLLRATATVLTVHNLRYRGPDDFSDLLGPGIYYADRVTTVSRTYAREVVTPAGGEGLDDLLRLRGSRLSGIVNGVDTTLFAPASDPALPEPFGPGALDDRAASRLALADELSLSPGPLAAMVTRLTEQKGVDLVIDALPEIVEAGWHLAVLGNGDRHLEEALAAAQDAYPSSVRFIEGYNDRLARLLYAGSDLFLMPSRFEPCGLGQMIAMRYGSVPLAHRTGGLADTIDDGVTGFLFDGFGREPFLAAFHRAADTLRDAPRWRAMQQAGMARDWSWTVPAAQYADVYLQALASRR